MNKSINEQVAPGVNSKLTRHSLNIANLPTIDMHDGGAVQHRVFEYFDICLDDDIKPTASGLALSLNMSRPSLYDIVNGKNRAYNNDVVVTIKKALNILTNQLELYSVSGAVNPVTGIFLMKNSGGGWRDVQQHELINDNSGENVTVEQLQQGASALKLE